MLPWTIALVLGAKDLYKQVRSPEDALAKFLWAWFLSGLLFWTIAQFRHHHYCIPILPPLSILCGKLLAEHAEQLGQRARGFYIAVFAITAIAYGIVGGIIMPRRDPRRETVAFVREVIPKVPAEASLETVGLAQSAVYPYIERDFGYVNSVAESREKLQRPSDRPVWVLVLRGHLQLAAKQGIVVKEVASEPARKNRPHEKTLILGTIVTPTTMVPSPQH